MNGSDAKNSLPIVSSLFVAVFIVSLAATYSYRDHALFSQYAKQTARQEGMVLLAGLRTWTERGAVRFLNTEILTNATLRVCRNSSARIYSFISPDMQVVDAGLEKLPTCYLAELQSTEFQTNGPRFICHETEDGKFLLFISPVFRQRASQAGLHNDSSSTNGFLVPPLDGRLIAGSSGNAKSAIPGATPPVASSEIRHFCRLLTGRSCQMQLKRMEGAELPLVIIGIPTSTYLAFINPRRSHFLLSLSVFSVATFALIFIVGMLRERRSVVRSLMAAQSENERLQKEKIFNDRLVTIGRAAAAIAHDLRNPLSSIRGFIELFAKHAKETEDETYARHTTVMLREIDRMNSRITGILNFAKPENLKLERREIGDVLRQLRVLEEAEANARGVDLIIDLGQNIRPVMLDDGVFMRAALNLCVNAFDAMPYGGELRILARDGGKELILNFIDSGNGISSDMVDRLFEPFITSKAAGTGLGLASVDKAVAAHGGSIKARNASGGGAVFEIRLPYAPDVEETKK